MAPDTLKTIQHWIGGKDFTGGSTRTAKVWNPATGEVQAEVVVEADAEKSPVAGDGEGEG